MVLYIHIGMQRTGTTFLQYNVFPFLKDVNLVDFKVSKNNGVSGRKEIKNILTNLENYNEDIISNKVKRGFVKDKINLISEENINCRMFTKEDKRNIKLKMLKKFFPNAKIIFGIREKENLIVSWYIKYVMNGGILGFNEYLKKVVNLAKFNYEPFINSLNLLFGRNNVYVYDFGDLKRDKASFVEDMCRFLNAETPDFTDVKKNVSYSLNQIKITLFFNRFFKSPLNPKGFISFPEYYVPHRYLFNSKFFSNLPRKKINIDDLSRKTV